MLVGEALQRWAACLSMNATAACQLASGDAWMVLGLLCVVLLVVIAGRKLVTALFTWRARALMPTLSRRLARWVKARDYTDEAFFRADGATEHWVEQRKAAIERLAAFFQT